MAIRISRDTIVFRHPFRIAGLDGTQAAGAYLVETDEELLEAASFITYRRVATHIHLPARSGGGGADPRVGIDPAALTAALTRDIKADASLPWSGRPAPHGPAEPPSRLPKFRNDQGVAEIRIGTRAFLCVGESPPQDHPHVYIDMGAGDTILCPYCATRFRFDPHLDRSAADPPECLYGTS